MRGPLVLICVAVMAGLASGATGIPPRPSASDYPARQNAASLTVAAALLSPEQTKQFLGDDINALGYMVVEVAVYPDPDHKVAVAARDFTLHLTPGGASEQAVAPAGLPQPLEAALHDKALPEGGSAEPVAGYLYFPKLPLHKQKKGVSIDLMWNAPDGPVRVTLLASR